MNEEQFKWMEKELDGLDPGISTSVMSHYPILGTTQVLVGGGHSDFKKLTDLFYKH